MKQILQNLRTGEIEVAELPAQGAAPGRVLIQTRRSLISAGTERMLVEFSRANLVQKARQQPEKVKQVLDKVRTDGLLPTLETVFRRLDTPIPLGYCNAGIVLGGEEDSGAEGPKDQGTEGPRDQATKGLGGRDQKSEIRDQGAEGRGQRAEVSDQNPTSDLRPPTSDLRTSPFLPGTRVISNGPHAEIVCVPVNLCARIPDTVTDEHAAFTVIGAVALQGIRLAQPSLGETFVVFGLGLVGLLTVQLLRANGCAVIGVDLNPDRLALARRFGATVVDISHGDDPVRAALTLTNGTGVDGVLITASSKTDDIVHQAALSCRKRGRIVLVGVVGINLQRSDFYEKELSFQVSCSYGPGRYDEDYEQKGHDYPVGFVRWTEQRNFEAVLAMIGSGRLDVAPLITHRYQLGDAVHAYEKVQQDSGALGVLLEYPETVSLARKLDVRREMAGVERPRDQGAKGPRDQGTGRPVVGVIGAGGFANGILLPALADMRAELRMIADVNPPAARHAASKFGFREAVTDYRLILDDPDVTTVFVVVGHHLHARFVCEALQAGKHVYVEKPMALDRKQLDQVISAYSAVPRSNPATSGSLLMVGFNRRFSAHTQKIKTLLAGRVAPLCMTMTVNAGFIPPNHWVQDPERGGGRIIGEGCHFIDLLSFLAASPVVSVSAAQMGGGAGRLGDNMAIALCFGDGSIGTVNYFANGSRSFPKETIEIFSDGRVIRMDNFRRTTGYGVCGFRSFRTWRQDKGHRAEIAAFLDAVAERMECPIPFGESVNATLASFAAVRAAAESRTVLLSEGA